MNEIICAISAPSEEGCGLGIVHADPSIGGIEMLYKSLYGAEAYLSCVTIAPVTVGGMALYGVFYNTWPWEFYFDEAYAYPSPVLLLKRSAGRMKRLTVVEIESLGEQASRDGKVLIRVPHKTIGQFVDYREGSNRTAAPQNL